MPDEEIQVETPAEEEITQEEIPAEEVSTEEVQDEVPAGEEEETPPKISNTQLRINKAVRKQREAERETKRVREELSDLSKKAEEKEHANKPKLEDFDSEIEYLDASFAYQNRVSADKLRSEFETDRRKEIQTTTQQTHEKLFKAGREKYPDFDKSALSEDVPYSDAMADAVFESDSAVDLMNYFGKHLDEAERIESLSPLSAAREVGKIESKLNQGITKKLTTAPKPITAVGSSETVKKGYSDEMTQDEYERGRIKGTIK